VLTVERNPDWYDDDTLFIHDVQVVPLSARVQANAGRAFLAQAMDSTQGADEADHLALVDRAVEHLDRALAIDPEIVAAHFALGVAFDRRGDYERMEAAWNQARSRFPDHPLFGAYDPILADRLSRRAVAAAQAGDGSAARAFLERAVKYQPGDGRLWYYLGRLRSAHGDSAGAATAGRRAAELGVTGEGTP
jgi:tetratricopeptide (TPR) repeat protein